MLAKMLLLLGNWMQITLGQEGKITDRKERKYRDRQRFLTIFYTHLVIRLLNAEYQQHEGNCFDDLGQDVFNFKHSLHRSLKEAAPKSSKGLKCNSGSKKLNNSRPPAIIKSSGS